MRNIASAHVEPLARLSLVTRALTSELSPAELIDIVVRQGMAELEADGGVLALLDDAAGLTALSTFGSATVAVDGIGRLTLDRDLPLVVAARDRLPVWISTRAEGEARFPALARVAAESQAWAAVPLIANGRVIGALGITFVIPRPFSEQERLFIRALADVAALALAAHPTWLTTARNGALSADGPIRDRTEVALLDLAGVIVWVNDAWIEFARANGGDMDACGVGQSYLDVCDRAADEPHAVVAAAAIRDVLSHGGPGVMVCRFRCDSPTEERQYELLVSARHDHERRVGATVVITRAHDDIVTALTPIVDVVRATERELAEQRQVNERLEQALARNVAIEQAKGMLASERGITVAQAFDQLRRHARRTRTPLHEVAHAVVTLSLRPPIEPPTSSGAMSPATAPVGADVTPQSQALGAISDVSRVALALAPLVGTDPLGQYARGVIAAVDQLLIDIRNAATNRSVTFVEVLDRTERAMADLATSLDMLAANDDIGEARTAALLDAVRLARATTASLRGRRDGRTPMVAADGA